VILCQYVITVITLKAGQSESQSTEDSVLRTTYGVLRTTIRRLLGVEGANDWLELGL
jgi:hypothetical protein